MYVPWVEERLADDSARMHDDPAEPELDGLDSLAARLRNVGPAPLRAVVMLIEEPDLCRGQVAEVMIDLMERALLGRLDLETTKYVAAFGGADFTRMATARLREPALDDVLDLSTPALDLLLANQDDPDVYATLVKYAGRHPQPLLEAGLSLSTEEPARQIDALLAALDDLEGPAEEKVRIWTEALRSLIFELPGAERLALRGRCTEATGRILGYSNVASRSAQPKHPGTPDVLNPRRHAAFALPARSGTGGCPHGPGLRKRKTVPLLSGEPRTGQRPAGRSGT